MLDVWKRADLRGASLNSPHGHGLNRHGAVAHVLTMLGGPMERMESWGPPGRNKRRPCKVRVSLSGRTATKALLGSVENWHATD